MAAKDCVKHGAAPVFTIAFPALRPVHARITAKIVLVREIVKMMVMMIVMTMMNKMTVNLGFVDANSIRCLGDIFQPVSFESPHVCKECNLSVRYHCPLMESKENEPYPLKYAYLRPDVKEKPSVWNKDILKLQMLLCSSSRQKQYYICKLKVSLATVAMATV